LSGRIEWHDDWVEFSSEARDFMQRLMTLDPMQRLGANGAEEVKAHPFLAGIDWNTVTTSEAAFIPQVTDPESTDYFDPRGAVLQLFNEEDNTSLLANAVADGRSVAFDVPIPASASVPVPSVGKEGSSTSSADDFGAFSFKNLPVLKQANDDVIRKLKTDLMTPMVQSLNDPNTAMHSRRRSLSQRMKKPPGNLITTALDSSNKPSTTNPPSPATSTSSIASSPSRGPSTSGSTAGHVRKPSEFGTVERFKLSHLEGDISRRNSMPSRLRTASVSTSGDDSVPGSASIGQASSVPDVNTPASSIASIDLKRGPDPNDRAVTCLLAEDNPITAKIIETLLSRLGCRCVVVADGSEAISVAMGDISKLFLPLRELSTMLIRY
jgi:serine/threonine-protein kinase RIM15